MVFLGGEGVVVVVGGVKRPQGQTLVDDYWLDGVNLQMNTWLSTDCEFTLQDWSPSRGSSSTPSWSTRRSTTSSCCRRLSRKWMLTRFYFVIKMLRYPDIHPRRQWMWTSWPNRSSKTILSSSSGSRSSLTPTTMGRSTALWRPGEVSAWAVGKVAGPDYNRGQPCQGQYEGPPALPPSLPPTPT